MKNKKTYLFVLLVLISCGLFGCNNVQDVEDQLDIYCFEAGYGVEWCRNIIDAFEEEDWVKQKYPGLKISFTSNDVASFAKGSLNSGKKGNRFDLLFCDANYIDINNTDLYADLTDGVYKQTVPGENVTYEEKCLSSYNDSNRFVEKSIEGSTNKYYFAPWAGGMNGIFYNEDILKSLNLSVPLTTDQLIQECYYIKSLEGTNSSYNKGYSFIQHGGTTYWEYLFPIWWTQYQGQQGYLDFWNGIDDNRISLSIFKQLGRLKSLEVYEKLLDYNNGFLNKQSFTYEAMTAQYMFLQGSGVFHVNGDWFDNEMKKQKANIIEAGTNYVIKMMRTPIISAIVETLEYRDGEDYMSDTMLAQVVDEIDKGATSYEGVSDSDFKKLIEARSVVQSVGPGHISIVPSYASQKDIAMDFLLYMATDKANEIYTESTAGASLPFNYNIKEKNPNIYTNLSDIQKGRIDYFYSNNLDVSVLAFPKAFPLARYGGLKEFIYPSNNVSASYRLFASSENKNSDGTNKITALDVYNNTISVWTNDSWTNALNKAGIER